MGTPMSGGQLLAALKAEGCKVREWPGWNGYGRPQSWGPINGVMIHHTGSDSQADSYVSNVLRSGYAGLPGPLCHVGIAMDGTVHLIASGRANHAGGGDPNVLAKVVAEGATATLKPGYGNTTPGKADGNARFYGAEVMYDGGQLMTSAQRDATVRFAAAICRHYGWSARSVIGHRTWSADKWDPGQEDIGNLQQLVQVRLNTNLGSSGTIGKDWFDMATKKELEDLLKPLNDKLDDIEHRVGRYMAPPKGVNSSMKKWTLGSFATYTLDVLTAGLKRVEGKLDQILAQVSK